VPELPRGEYPRPQFRRDDWLCLNGTWGFEIDRADSGLERGLRDVPLAGEITVPFCPESVLSGVGDTDFLRAVWYRRTIDIPADWAGRRILLHFGAVDYDTTVWVDGEEVGRHRGGFTPFTCDLGERTGSLTVVLRARDPERSPQARGKQSRKYEMYSCNYTRTTGIWQTVWAEPVPELHLRRSRITPDVAAGAFWIEQPLSGNKPGYKVRAVLSDGAGEVVSATARADLDLAPRLVLQVPTDRQHLWSTSDPHLYALRLELLDDSGAVVDSVDSYAGLRSVSIDGVAVKINGEPVFQRLVLDQGYYPDGVMTAPTDAALKRDIELSLAAGFNGARLHQKVFEERFLYHADKLGYLVWGEFGDWGCNEAEFSRYSGTDYQKPDASYITQWLEALERDYSHPSIIGWCPLNETHQPIADWVTVLDDVTRGMYLATKAFDTSRPVVDASGYSHRVRAADIYDSHNYEQDPEKFAAAMAGLADGKPYANGDDFSVPYTGQPYFCSEFGGIWWQPKAADGEYSWGYGDRPKTVEEFYDRFAGLCSALLDNPLMFGYCYTQLTDVHQEQNGIYDFDRSEKFDLARIRAAQQRPAAIEQ
jgi:beta-galactosidase/beta-glucuronidase